MTFQKLIYSFPWTRFSKKLQLRIDLPFCIGVFTPQDAQERTLHLATNSQGNEADGNKIAIFWLVDPTDGVIVDAKYTAFGNSALIGAAEVACELIVGKNYDQARRITTELIDRHVRDHADTPAFPQETFGHLNMVIDAIEGAATTCEAIPLAESYIAPPVMGHQVAVIEGGYPGYLELPLKQKMALIEEVLQREVRPYIELDAGGITLLRITNNTEVAIAYQGACTSCHSATGATLSYIQHTLKAQVHPDIIVTPEI